jgi:hypothetical protein
MKWKWLADLYFDMVQLDTCQTTTTARRIHQHFARFVVYNNCTNTLRNFTGYLNTNLAAQITDVATHMRIMIKSSSLSIYIYITNPNHSQL